ncbi:alpha-tocopherol transfer protein-like [Trichoplusia ni]|uniref:Alpha-tocopherol transfer protein-like n=1 Tax=Trichoplusia ni TaxID=7111 RepID=A0A7E5VIK6_TRINI|nr:alpha-tocopherol transfer protein-like [Trichoplusia ni]
MVVLKDKILNFHPDTLYVARKDVNLEKEERIEEALDILEGWVKKQTHFAKKDFSRDYLERTLITAKGLVERAKVRIDKLCTFKTLMPDLYPSSVSRTDYEVLEKYLNHAHLPTLTKDHYRVYLLQLNADDFSSSVVNTYYRYIVVTSEYLKIHDYNCGFIVALDFRNINILNVVAKCTPMELRQIVTLMTEGYSMRIKQIHIITASKMVDALLALFRQVLSSKLAKRITLHKNLDTFYEYVPKDILPIEYNGTERSLKKLNEEFIAELTSEEFVKYFEEMYKANTDESCRPSDKFNEQYVGMPGSFRALSVD